MNYLSLLLLLSLLLHLSCCWTPFSASSSTSSEKVLLHQVDKIVLRDGHMTNSRRVNAIPQLRCVGGTAGCSSLPRPNLVVCSNAGRDRNDATWDCEADFDNKYKFGRIQVSCEGYDYPEDSYVLKDSCGLEYEIDYDNSHTGNYGYSNSSHESSFSLSNLLVILAICLLIYGIYRNTQGTGEERDGTPSTSSSSTDPSGATGASSSSTHSPGASSSSTHCSGASSSSTHSPGATGGWSNFLSGMFVGGIASSMFSMISSLFRPRYGYGAGYGRGYGYGGFGGGRRGYTGGMGSWGGASSGGGTSRKSGFGGTGRR